MDLVARVKAILLTPQSEWPVIEREPGDAPYLFTNYVAILAAIPPLAGFIGGSLIGFSVAGVGTVRLGFFSGLIHAIVGYLLTFVAVYVVALIIDALAPTFGAQKNFDNALRISAYYPTPYWLAGIFSLVPRLSFLAILGLYGIYLLYLGLPALMKAPADKAVAYTAAVIVCSIGVMIVIALILGTLFGFSAGLF
jgi:hypothetical protein